MQGRLAEKCPNYESKDHGYLPYVPFHLDCRLSHISTNEHNSKLVLPLQTARGYLNPGPLYVELDAFNYDNKSKRMDLASVVED